MLHHWDQNWALKLSKYLFYLLNMTIIYNCYPTNIYDQNHQTPTKEEFSRENYTFGKAL